MVLEHAKETSSTISKNIISNFDEKIKNFVQVCPKEMINKLKNPITLKSNIKEVS
jgi:glutamate synthase (NADPH/NADH) large chain